MAPIYSRVEQVRYPDAKSMIIDHKAISDAAWEGYSKGYASVRAQIDNAHNDAMFLRSMMQGNPIGMSSPGSRRPSILDTPSETHDPLKTKGFNESMIRQGYTPGGFKIGGDTSYVEPASEVAYREPVTIQYPTDSGV